MSENSSQTKNEQNPGNTSKSEDLQKQLAEKDAEIKKLEEENKKHSDDIAPNIRKDHTFAGVFKNGYTDGTVAKEAKKQKIASIAK